MEVMADPPQHIHLFVGAKPTVSPIDIVRTLNSITAIELFRQYSKLKHFMAGVVLYGLRVHLFQQLEMYLLRR